MEISTKEYERLLARISELEERVSSIPYQSWPEDMEGRISALEESPSVAQQDLRRTYEDAEAPKKSPFDVISEVVDEEIKFFVFAPEGCVIVDGAPASVPGVDDDGYVELTDLGTDESVKSVYCHVAKSGESWSATFDCVENSDAKYTFKIRTFGSYNGDGKSFTMADSVVFITDKTDQEISGTISYIADVIYDEAYHQIKQRTDTKELATGQVTEGDYEVVTTAVALSSEV